MFYLLLSEDTISIRKMLRFSTLKVIFDSKDRIFGTLKL